MLKTVERRQIYQEEIIPESALDELIREYGKRWPLKETPGSLGELLEVLL